MPENKLIADQYRVERVLGGGMGTVSIALDTISGKRFALKTIRDAAGGEAPERDAIVRFEREATAWINLDHHPHVVQAHAFFRWDERPYLLLEFVDGPSLLQVLRQTGPLAAGQAVRWALAICAGMQHVHTGSDADGRAGIVHRDLKPGNVLLTTSGTAKITDFGLAKIRDETALTSTGQFLGTLAYCSPEQVRSARSVEQASDVFSFGVMLYEMLTGRRPFDGENASQLISAIEHREPDLDAVPETLRPIVAGCLQKSPARRFASFDAVAEALRSVAGERPFDEALTACEGCGFRHPRPLCCPVCGQQVGAGALDATVLYGPAQNGPGGERKAAAAAEVLCRCGARVAPDARFCRRCGAPAPTIECACGQRNSALNEFCNRCGDRLRGPSTPSENPR